MRQNELIENIKFNGIVSLAIILFTITIPYVLMGGNLNNFNNIESIEKSKNNLIVEINGDKKAKVYRTKTDKVENIDVEEYITGVVSSEMPVSFEEEALKSQAIAARTFYYSKKYQKCPKAKGGEICDDVHCQAYMNENERKEKWSKKDRQKNYEKVKKAVEDTKGMVLMYDGDIVRYPQFFSTSSGKTENSQDVFSSEIPYLKSVNSPGEEVSPKFKTEKNISNDKFVEIFKNKYNKSNLKNENLKSQIQIVKRTEGGSVEEIKIGNESIKGTEFRKIYDLSSANFIIEFKKNEITIKCNGSGHGVGMSQWGANVMAKNGESYDNILKHYYKGIEIGKIIYK